jgi:hypothetical protein
VGFDRALQKRAVSEEKIEAAVRAVVHQLRMTAEREIESRRVGGFVMDELRKLDHVGYVRFASVYRSFEDVADFREELDRLERDLAGSPTAGKEKNDECFFRHRSRVDGARAALGRTWPIHHAAQPDGGLRACAG